MIPTMSGSDEPDDPGWSGPVRRSESSPAAALPERVTTSDRFPAASKAKTRVAVRAGADGACGVDLHLARTARSDRRAIGRGLTGTCAVAAHDQIVRGVRRVRPRQPDGAALTDLPGEPRHRPRGGDVSPLFLATWVTGLAQFPATSRVNTA